MALAVDVGAMYSTGAQLHRTANAAALAAVAQMGDSPEYYGTGKQPVVRYSGRPPPLFTQSTRLLRSTSPQIVKKRADPFARREMNRT
jgi:hypothetical protein